MQILARQGSIPWKVLLTRRLKARKKVLTKFCQVLANKDYPEQSHQGINIEPISLRLKEGVAPPSEFRHQVAADEITDRQSVATLEIIDGIKSVRGMCSMFRGKSVSATS